MKKYLVLSILMAAGFISGAAIHSKKATRQLVNLNPEPMYVRIKDNNGNALMPVGVELKQFKKDKDMYLLPSNAAIQLPDEIESFRVRFWPMEIDYVAEKDLKYVDGLSYGGMILDKPFAMVFYNYLYPDKLTALNALHPVSMKTLLSNIIRSKQGLRLQTNLYWIHGGINTDKPIFEGSAEPMVIDFNLPAHPSMQNTLLDLLEQKK